jgi:hypothetical protein
VSANGVAEADKGLRRTVERERATFVSDFLYLTRCFEKVSPVLMDPQAAWLERLNEGTGQATSTVKGTGCIAADKVPAAPTGARGFTRATVRTAAGRRCGTTTIRIALGPARQRGEAVIVPVRWEPSWDEPLLPLLVGDLELASAGRCVSRLALVAWFRLPPVPLGCEIDAGAVRGAAESLLRRFLEDTSSALCAST